MVRSWGIAALVWLSINAWGQSGKPFRMEILLEKEDHDKAVVMEPGHVFEQGDRLRFRFTSNFTGVLFVMDRGTSGTYSMLFPKEDIGTDDHIEAGRTYLLPAKDKGWFRVTGPAGHDIVYFVVSSATGGSGSASVPVTHLPAPAQPATSTMKPRCNDEMFRARGDCIDLSAGPKAAGEGLPDVLTGMRARDLFFIRQDKSTVVSSKEPLDTPVVYEFHVAHK